MLTVKNRRCSDLDSFVAHRRLCCVETPGGRGGGGGGGGGVGRLLVNCVPMLSFFPSILSRSNFDHHLRCGGWLNFEFSKREKHSGWAIKTIYKKLCRGMLKHIPLYLFHMG